MEYSWVKLNGHEPSPKIAFVKSIPEWGWQIGAGFYVDDIDGEIATRAAILREGLVRSAYPLGGLLLALLGLSFLIRSFRPSSQVPSLGLSDRLQQGEWSGKSGRLRPGVD